MKLRQRLVSLRVSWLVDRGRIAPHHRNWRQRGIGEGIARSPPQLSVIQKRSKERIQRSDEGTSRCKKNKISFSEELDLLAPQRTQGFTGSSSSDFSARSKTPSIRWWREELSALQSSTASVSLFYASLYILWLLLNSRWLALLARIFKTSRNGVIGARIGYCVLHNLVVSVCLRSTQICFELQNGDSQPGARLTLQDPGDTYKYLVCL